MNKKLAGIYVVATMVILAIPFVGMSVAKTDWTTENKPLSEFPALIEEGKFNVDFLEECGAYFEDHFAWENKLSLSLKETLNDMNKSYEYDFVYDSLLITFTQDEVDTMLLRYPEQETKDVMDHFSRLLTDYIYTREYQERIHDYYADAVSKMKNKNNLEFDDINITNDKKKSKSLFKKR